MNDGMSMRIRNVRSSARAGVYRGMPMLCASPDVVGSACKQLQLQFWLQFTVVWQRPLTFNDSADLHRSTAVDVGGQRIPPS